MACALVAELITAAALAAPAVRNQPSAARPAVAATGEVQRQFVVEDRVVRSVNLGGQDTARLLSRVEADMPAAVDAVVAFWGADWSPEISVLATGSDEQFRVAAGGGPTSQWADIAAVTVADRVEPTSRTVVGPRIVFAPGAVRMSDIALRIVLTHELFHYAARADTALDAPRWLTEGVADYVARNEGPALPAIRPQALPSDADLDATGPQRSLAYDQAWWFARFVASAWGPAKLRDLYLATCGTRHADVAAALGLNTAGLLLRWQQWMASH